MEDRRPPYGIAFCLLLAGLLPVMSRDAEGKFSFAFFEPPQLVAAVDPDLGKVATFYPAAAGLAVLILGRLLPRWLTALVCIAIGAALPAYLIWKTNLAIATNGLLLALDLWDAAILGGIATVFVFGRAQALSRPWLPLTFLCALGGVAALTWLVAPRLATGCDLLLQTVTVQPPPEKLPFINDIAIARGFLHNQDYPEGTHFIWYAWFNVYLIALLFFPLLSLRALFGSAENRPYRCGSTYGVLLIVLIALLMMHIVAAAFDINQQGAGAATVEALINAANAIRVYFPPFMLPALALMGFSELMICIVPSRKAGTNTT